MIHIPTEKLPKLLQVPCILLNLASIQVIYSKMNFVNPGREFVKTYGPRIKFYNPSIVVQKKVTEDFQDFRIVITKKSGQEVEIKDDKITPEVILQKIEEINSEDAKPQEESASTEQQQQKQQQ